jgi:hypothetical protein
MKSNKIFFMDQDNMSETPRLPKRYFNFIFYILLTVHLGTNLLNNQLDVQFLCIYFNSLHVSSNLVLIIRRINCINTASVVCHCV